MEIKGILNYLKKHFDRMILLAVGIILLASFLKYIGLLHGKSIPTEEKDFYNFTGVSPRLKSEREDKAAFREFVDRKTNFILGLTPVVFYEKLMGRNPFTVTRELVVKPFSISPPTLSIGAGKRFTFQTQNGIGPYKWECEPASAGRFEGDEFIAADIGSGKIIATDARGHRAAADIEVAASDVKIFVPVEDKVFRYRGIMKIITLEGEQVLAVVEDRASGMTYFKKAGEEVAGFLVKEVTQEALVLLDKKKGKEIELRRE